MPTCLKCNTYNNLEQTHCKKCQATLPVEVENSCPRCAAKNGPFAKKCRSCNFNLKQGNTPKPSVPKSTTKPSNSSGQTPNIIFRCEVDHFTKETLYENYAILAKELNVRPKVIIHKRGTILSDDCIGFYNYKSGEIEIVDTYYLISVLAHEMRHVYQHIHKPQFFYNTRITNLYEYISSPIEVDARKFAIDYCKRRKYNEEMNYLINEENNYKLFLNGHLSAAAVGLGEDRYETNPLDLQVLVESSIEVKPSHIERPQQNVPKPKPEPKVRPKEAAKNRPKKAMTKTANRSTTKSQALITEIVLLVLIGILCFFTNGHFKGNLIVFLVFTFFIHLVYTIHYTVKHYHRFGIIQAFKRFVKHALILFAILVALLVI